MDELCHDGRSSNVELAQRLGLSVATVAKKIKAMIETGIIVIKAMPNPMKVGYKTQAFIGLHVDLKKVDSVCNLLMDNINVNTMAITFGRFNILLVVFFRELQMLIDFIKEELSKIEGINRIETYLVLEEVKRGKGVFPKATESKPTLLDELDQKIIEELMRDGRSNYAALANKLGVSRPKLSRRINLLLKEDVIKILAIPNPSKMGYSANAYIFILAELAKINKICDQLSKYSEVHTVMRIMGNSDILVGVFSSNPDTLYEFLKEKVGNIDGILSIDTFICRHFHYYSVNAVYPLILGIVQRR